jgi:hypothetical protein
MLVNSYRNSSWHLIAYLILKYKIYLMMADAIYGTGVANPFGVLLL